MAPTVPPVTTAGTDSKPALNDELHMVDASDAVALYGLCITATGFLIILVIGLCCFCLGLVTTISGLISLGLLIVVRQVEWRAVLCISLFFFMS